MNRSGQVKPSNTMPASFRTALEPPSAPIRYWPRSVSFSPAAFCDRRLDEILALRQPDELRRETYLAEPARPDMRQSGVDQLVLLPLHHVGIRHLALEHADIEHRDQFAGGAVAEMKQRRLHAARGRVGKHLRLQAEIDQHLDRRRMDRRGALILGGVGQLLDQRDRDALLDQRQGHDGADRPAPGNDHAMVGVALTVIHSVIPGPSEARSPESIFADL